jgi:hypothetical protein
MSSLPLSRLHDADVVEVALLQAALVYVARAAFEITETGPHLYL